MSEFPPPSTTTKKTDRLSSLLLSDLFLFCSFILSHPLYFSYLVFFSPYLFKLLSFLSPLFITTSLLLLALLTISPSLVNDNSHTELYGSKVSFFYLQTYQAVVERLRSKVEDGTDQEFHHFEELEAYKIVFETSSTLGIEENHAVEVTEVEQAKDQSACSGTGQSVQVHEGSIFHQVFGACGVSDQVVDVNLDENSVLITRSESNGHELIAEGKTLGGFLHQKEEFEDIWFQKEEKEALKPLNVNFNKADWPAHGLPNNSNINTSISPKSSPFLSYDNIRLGSVLVPPFSRNGGNDGGDCSNNSVDFPDESQLDDYLSFLDDPSSKNEGFMDQRVQLGGYPVDNGDSHLHRRRFSESDACFGAEDGGFGLGYKPCLYFARGFCKNGESCKFVHGGENMAEDNGGGVLVGSPREMEELYLQQQEELMRMKAAQQQQQQRLAYNKYMNFLLQQQNKTDRLGAAAAMMGNEFYNFSRLRGGRNDFFAMGMAEKANSASRQIYLTFPADSSFKDEDVSNYFCSFGPVQDVRIPYQQKRMFGFVTFVHPETVKEILAKGNPHYICESRVLVKPYKEKGKVANKMQQLLERGNFSPTSSPSGFDPRELRDLHLGARMLYNTPEIMLRRKLEEQAELQQAIELQGRRLINLQLPDLRGDYVQRHQRSLSVGAPISMHAHHTPINQTDILTSNGKNEITLEDKGNLSGATKSTYIAAIEQNLQDEVNAAYIQNNDNVNCKVESFTESHGSNVEPNNLTKSSENQHPDLFPYAKAKESNGLSVSSWSENDASVPATSASDEASH